MNYLDIISRKYPNVFVSCVGDPEVLNDIVWEAGEPIPPVEQLETDHLELLREDIWVAIKAERDYRYVITGTPVAGKWYHSDEVSKLQQVALQAAAGLNILPANLMWKTMDGSFVQMTNQLALQIFGGAMSKGTEIFSVAEQHRLTMLALPDPTGYDFSANWPQTYAEYAATL